MMRNVKWWGLRTLCMCIVMLIASTSMASINADAVEAKVDNSGRWKYMLADDSATLTGYEGAKPQGVLSIPSTVDGYAVVAIGNEAFLGCEEITNVVIPDGVQSIGDRTFRECIALTGVVIPDSVISLGEGAFARCGSLSDVEITKGVTTMGMNPFYGCPIKSFSVSPDNLSYLAVDGVLFDKQKETLVSYPSGKKGNKYSIPNGTRTIASGAFMFCSDLTNISIPSSTASVEDFAFLGCSGITSISIPDNVTNVGDGVFSNCDTLAKVTLSNSLSAIGDNTFYQCGSLTSISIPNSVTSIGDGAFRECGKLAKATLPNSLETIGNNAFYECNSLTSISIPNSVVNIGRAAFFLCTNLTNINLPDNLTAISDGVLGGCRSLTNITIPNSVTSIGAFAFSACQGLRTIVIPESVAFIGEDAFSGCGIFELFSLTVTSGSIAVQYAIANDIPIINSDGEQAIVEAGRLSEEKKPAERVEDEQKAAEEKNVIESVSLKDVIIDADKYDGQFIRIADELAVFKNDVMEKKYIANLVIGKGPYDVSSRPWEIEIYYGNMEDYRTWAELDTTGPNPRVFVSGTIHKTNLYPLNGMMILDATEIVVQPWVDRR